MFVGLVKNLLFPLVLLALSACSSTNYLQQRLQLADSVAVAADLQPFQLRANGFDLKGYGRVSDSSKPLVIYIEGDGRAWLRSGPSPNPTPVNPLALRLAAADVSPNVVYLARPCQYTAAPCELKYWTSHRMADDVIVAYQQAVNSLLAQHSLKSVRLVGFSGGGGVAVLLAARLMDSGDVAINDLRTVAGNLDHATWTSELAVTPLVGSLNPADVATDVSELPQLHFVGVNDRVISYSVYRAYRQRAADSTCFTVRKAQASHVKGWESLWPGLQKLQPEC